MFFPSFSHQVAVPGECLADSFIQAWMTKVKFIYCSLKCSVLSDSPIQFLWKPNQFIAVFKILKKVAAVFSSSVPTFTHYLFYFFCAPCIGILWLIGAYQMLPIPGQYPSPFPKAPTAGPAVHPETMVQAHGMTSLPGQDDGQMVSINIWWLVNLKLGT